MLNRIGKIFQKHCLPHWLLILFKATIIVAILVVLTLIFKLYAINIAANKIIAESSINTAQNTVNKFDINAGYDVGPYHIDYNDLKTIPWNIKEPHLVGHSANIQKFHFVTPLYDAYLATNDTKYLTVAKNICLEWIKIHSGSSKDLSVFTWYEMIDGVRGVAFSKIFLACEKENILTPDEKRILLESLKQHVNYLMNDKNIRYDTNHGFFQIVSQLKLSKSLISYDPIYKQSYKQALKRLKKIIKLQFYMKDGIQKENSPAYHSAVSAYLYSLIEEGFLNSKQILFAKKAKDNTYWLTLPNFHIVSMGDSDYTSIFNELPKITETYRVFREAGYFAVRDNQSYLLQHAGYGSRGHRHSDDLGFVWYDLGQNILMDAGKYAYVGKPSTDTDKMAWSMFLNRRYILSSAAHNTLEFNDHTTGIYPKTFYNAIKKAGYNEKENYYFVKTRVKLRGVILERNLYYQPEKYLVVYDRFNSKRKDLTIAKQWFHLAPDLTMKKDGENYIINLKNGNKITVTQLNSRAKADRLYKGETEPKIQGWISMEYDKIEPNYAFNYQLLGSQKGEFITIFRINDSKIPDSITCCNKKSTFFLPAPNKK